MLSRASTGILGLTLLAAFAQPAQERAPRKSNVAILEVHALANEGFLLRSKDAAVLIDAFVAEPYLVYAALPKDPMTALINGDGVFASVDLALASHPHRDHFQPEPARRMLAAQPGCVLVSSPQVVGAVRGSRAAPAVDDKSLRSVWPDAAKQERVAIGDIQVDFLRLSHGTGRFADIQNLGHVITVGGVTALHVGDAAMVPDHFAPYQLPTRGIDVVFVPYWYFGDPRGRQIIDEHFLPAKLVACHIPPRELAAVTRALAASDPSVSVPQGALERFQFEDER